MKISKCEYIFIKAMGHADHVTNSVTDYRVFSPYTVKTRLLQGPSVPLTPTFAVYATLWLGR